MPRRYQNGTLEEARTAEGLFWYIRFTMPDGKSRPRFRVGKKSDFPTKAKADRAARSIRDKFNQSPEAITAGLRTFGDVINRYELEEMPERYSTRRGYGNIHRVHLRPKWGDSPLSDINPMDVRQWLKELPLATRTRGHIHAQMRQLFRFSMLWGWIPAQANPMSLFTIEGASKRQRKPRAIAVEMFQKMLQKQKTSEHRAMLVGAYCLGLRVSELFGLQWQDFDFLDGRVLIRRAIVAGRVGMVKTERSEAPLPLAKFVGETFLTWRRDAPYKEPCDWVFASPAMCGTAPRTNAWLQQEWLRPLGVAMELDFKLGWHTFRHSYKTLLDRVSDDMTVKRDLMRHADIHTTMQVYGEVEFDRMRSAHELAVELASRPVS